MKPTQWLSRLLAGGLLAFSALSVAQMPAAGPAFKEGEHYALITPPVNVGASDEVIVTEFFWYGCGHCYNFESMLQAWEGKLPDGVMFEPSPAMWNGPMELHAKAYYVAKALGALDAVHEKIFEAMHLKRKRLSNKDQIREIFVENGIDGEAFDKAFDSFGINSQVRQADAKARGARITGTPSMMVNGKYLIEARMAGGQAEMLEVADFLIQQELAAAAVEAAVAAN